MAAAELDLDVDAVKEMAQYYDFSTEITAADKEASNAPPISCIRQA